MNISVTSFADLTEQDIGGWRHLQQNDPELISPFYSPEFAGAVHHAGKPVNVALAYDDDQLSGILPYHKGRLGTGVPVGGQISDYQGLIGPSKNNVDCLKLLKACGLQAYDYNHLPANQLALANGHFSRSISPCIDLTHGFDAYIAERRSKKNKVLKNAVRNLRILERDIGPVRIEVDDPSEIAWQTLIMLKNQSFKQMGVQSMMDTGWAGKVFETVRKTKTPQFAGMVSSLYVGDNLAAVHFGMRSHAALHWWFPTYDQALSKYSPGIVLLLEVARRVPELGLINLDLGRGAQTYKRAFANGFTELYEGSIERTASLAGCTRKIRKSLDRSLTRLPILAKPALLQRRVLNRFLGAVYLPK